MRRFMSTLVVLALCASCRGEATQAEPEVRFEPDSNRFSGDPMPDGGTVFSVVAADMDLDGDADVIFNWHMKHPLEIFENTGDGFTQLNARANDRSGVWDNPGVPDLYADIEEMTRSIADLARPGLYVWHDEDRAEGYSWAGNKRSSGGRGNRAWGPPLVGECTPIARETEDVCPDTRGPESARLKTGRRSHLSPHR